MITQVVVVLAVGLLLPSFSYGITEAERIEQLNRAVQPLLSQGKYGTVSTAGSLAGQDASVAEAIKEAYRKVGIEKEGLEILDKRDKELAEVNKIKAADSLIDLTLTKLKLQKEAAAQKLEEMFPQMTTPANPFNRSRTQAKNKECKVDLNPYFAMTDLLNGEGMKFLQSKKDVLVESPEKRKFDLAATLSGMLKRFKKNNAEKREKERSKAFASEAQEKFSATEFTLEKRNQTWKDQTLDAIDDKFKRQDAFAERLVGPTGLMAQLFQAGKDRSKVAQVGAAVAKVYEDYRQFSFNAGITAAGDFKRKCEDHRDAILVGNADLGAPTSLLYTALEVAQTKNDDHYRLGFQQRATAAAQRLECRDSSAGIENALGSNLKTQIDALRTPPTAEALFTSMTNLAPIVATGIGSTEEPIVESKDDCDDAVNLKKKIEAMIQREQNAMASSSGNRPDGQGAQRRTGGSRNGRYDNNSLAGGPNSGSNRRNHNNTGRTF